MIDEETKVDLENINRTEETMYNESVENPWAKPESDGKRKVVAALAGLAGGGAAAGAGYFALQSYRKYQEAHQDDDENKDIAEADTEEKDNATHDAQPEVRHEVHHTYVEEHVHHTAHVEEPHQPVTPHTPIKPVVNNDDVTPDTKMYVVDVDTVENEDGTKDTYITVQIGGEKALLVDVGNNGSVDALVRDIDHDGHITENEILDIRESGYTTDDVYMASVNVGRTEDGQFYYASLTPGGGAVIIDGPDQGGDGSISILGADVVDDGKGGYNTIIGVEIDGERGMLVDLHSDGTIDLAVTDDNNDGNITRDEIHDISSKGITTEQLIAAADNVPGSANSASDVDGHVYATSYEDDDNYVRAQAVSFDEDEQNDDNLVAVAYNEDEQNDDNLVAVAYDEDEQYEVHAQNVSFDEDDQYQDGLVEASYAEANQEDDNLVAVAYEEPAQEDDNLVAVAYEEPAQEDDNLVAVAYEEPAQNDDNLVAVSYEEPAQDYASEQVEYVDEPTYEDPSSYDNGMADDSASGMLYEV